jgi:hypothetical protein
VLDASPIAQAVRTLLAAGEWTGTVADLLITLAAQVDDGSRRIKGWPTTPRMLAGVLRRLAPNLRAGGVGVIFLERTKRGRLLRLEPVGVGKESSPVSLSPPSDPGVGDGGDGGDGRVPALMARPDEGEL